MTEKLTLDGCQPRSEPGEWRGRVAERTGVHAHAVHDGEVKAAEFPVVVAAVEEIEHASSCDLAAESADEQHGHLARIMVASRPHVGNEHQAGVVENGGAAFWHRGQPAG